MLSSSRRIREDTSYVLVFLTFIKWNAEALHLQQHLVSVFFFFGKAAVHAVVSNVFSGGLCIQLLIDFLLNVQEITTTQLI